MISQFSDLVKKFLAYIDSGEIFSKPYQWLYMAIAAIHAIIPVVILISAFKQHLFDFPFKMVIAFLFILAVIVVAAAIGMLLWWNRKDQLKSNNNRHNDFVATPIFAHFIQTTGETFFVWLSTVGTATSLIAGIFLGSDSDGISSLIPLPLPPGIGFAGIVFFPLLGYFMLIIFRFLSEQVKALAAIANNTGALLIKPVTDYGNEA